MFQPLEFDRDFGLPLDDEEQEQAATVLAAALHEIGQVPPGEIVIQAIYAATSPDLQSAFRSKAERPPLPCGTCPELSFLRVARTLVFHLRQVYPRHDRTELVTGLLFWAFGPSSQYPKRYEN